MAVDYLSQNCIKITSQNFSAEVVSALVSRVKNRWFESRRGHPNQPVVEIGTWFLMELEKKEGGGNLE